MISFGDLKMKPWTWLLILTLMAVTFDAYAADPETLKAVAKWATLLSALCFASINPYTRYLQSQRNRVLQEGTEITAEFTRVEWSLYGNVDFTRFRRHLTASGL